MTDQDAFVSRIKRHRERNRISVTQIAVATCIREELIEGLERNDLDGWPRGIYARAYVRAYATTIGLDPDDTVDDFCRLFPQGNRRAEPTIKEIAAIVASESGWQDEFDRAEEQDRRKSPAINMLPKRNWLETSVLRLVSAAKVSWRRPRLAKSLPASRLRSAGPRLP